MASVWAHCRVSARKDEQEDSLEAQLQRPREFAASKNLELVPHEERASAKTLKRRPVF